MSIYINDETIEKVRDSCDIVNIVSDYVPLRKTGSNYVGLCPFHNEKTPSFTVSETKRLYHCFGCGEGGDAVTFIMKMENLSFPEAIKFLADKLGIPIEENKKINNKYIDEKNKCYKINREAALFFLNNLNNNETALQYLKRRNINKKVIKQFGLGYSLNNWDSLYNYLREKGYTQEEIEKTGLIGKKKGDNGYYDKFRNRIMFPIIDTKSRVVGFGGRVLDNSMPKYLNSQDTIVFSKGNQLYGLNLLNKYSNRKRIVLVEGYMDVISLYNNGINYGVASLGTALTESQVKLIKRYGESIYICYDSDLAGINATTKAIQLFLKEGIDPKIIMLPSGKDPDDFIKEKGIEGFEKLFNEALTHIDFKVYINKQKYDLNKAEDKIKFTRGIAQIIKELKSPIEKDVYIDKISKETNISKEAIEKEVFGKIDKVPYSNTYKDKYAQKNKNIKDNISPVKPILPSAYLTAEIDLIKLMIYDKDYFELINQKISLEEIENYECREIGQLITEEYEKEDILNEISLYKKIREKPNMDIDILNSIFERKLNFLPESIRQIIDDLVNTIVYWKLENRRKKIIEEIQEIEKKKEKNEGDVERFKSLCIEITELDKELKTHQ
ncbi:DNA primase [Tissierella sp. MSJ-40]|uniref:DNA primase n=2 Tax=Tissierella simiarum TaxID=2841534 RepID=A0ABS6E662_9FIRM|nr:DNA primase [Tissierella simiarum]MBU5438244.1 DNA primase [Tissierella simiarum]